jgi:formamidopyrimidine-DNA glycosylase
MPELPDLEAIRGFLAPRLVANPITAVDVTLPWLVRSEEKLESLVGHAINGVSRRGKFLVYELDDGRLLVVNAMLTGRLSWAEAKDKRRAGTVLALTFEDGHELQYVDQRRMGRWYIVGANDLDSVPQVAGLGPDALEIDEARFLAGLKKHRGQAKSVLTNQAFMAGIGNAYSDEILWQAGVHPHRRIATLDESERKRLFEAIGEVYAWAIPILEQEVSERLHQVNEEWRDHLRVHRKAGQPCPRCGSEIRGQTRGGSETNYCLTCQPLFGEVGSPATATGATGGSE